MRKRSLVNLIFGAMALMSVSSCQDYDANFSEEALLKQQYADQFEKVFGKIDPNQDWNFAQRINASINLSGIDGSCVVTFYNVSPISKESAILYKKELNGGSTVNVSFDSPKTNSSVYAVVKTENGLTPICKYFEIENGQITVSCQVVATRAMDSNTQIDLENPLSDDLVGSFQDNGNFWGQAEENNYGLWTNQHNNQVNFNKLYKVYNLTNVGATDGGTVKISDIVEIVGTGSVFNERGGNYSTPQYCNLAKWYNDLNAEKGAEYIIDKGGSPVEFDFMYGGTVNQNQIGYFYYSDGTSYEEAIKRPHYIIGTGRPQDNVKIDGNAMLTTEGMKLPELVTSYETSGANPVLTGTHYKLTYFGESGLDNANSTYTFPEGTHIVFFLVQNGLTAANSYGYKIENSVPIFNKMENKLWEDSRWHAGDHNYCSCPSGLGELDAVTYRWGGMTILGFEDRDEDDMNDILLFVKGKFSNEIKELKSTEDVYEWMVACEDLGNTDDYDFNDVVFGVKHYTSSTTLFRKYYLNGVLQEEVPTIISQENYLMVTPYAAGGSLKSDVYYGTTNLGEIHSLLRVDQKSTYDAMESGSMPILNADSHKYAGTPFIITLQNGEEFSMSSVADGDNNMGGFKILTHQKAGDSNGVVIEAPKTGAAPQMMVLPNGWDWPTERNSIYNVYEDFKNWSTDKTKNGWVANKQGSYVTNPYKTSIVEPGTGGSGSGSGNSGGPEMTPSQNTYQISLTECSAYNGYDWQNTQINWGYAIMFKDEENNYIPDFTNAKEVTLKIVADQQIDLSLQSNTSWSSYNQNFKEGREFPKTNAVMTFSSIPNDIDGLYFQANVELTNAKATLIVKY